MLIYSKEPLNVMMKNILLLDDPFTAGYVYVNKETYDQALSLSITYNQDIGRVKQTISGKGMLNWAANKAVSHVVSFCSEKFSAPLNMLAPYLAYTLPIGVEWPDDDEEMIRMAYGVLHQMSQFVNFYATALMPSGAKADIMIPKNIIMSYEDSWKAQLETLDKCVVAVPVYVEKEVAVAETAKVVDKQATIVAPVVEENDDTVPARDMTHKENAPTVQEESPIEKEEIVEQEVMPDDKEAEEPVGNQAGEDSEEAADTEEDGEGSDEEDDELEAKILAMMKQIEEAPAEEFQTKEMPKEEPVAEPVVEEKKEETVNYGESGSINMTEQEIAEGNRRLLNDYDI